MRRKKRVLIAASTYPPAFGGSGLESHRLYRRLMEALPIEVTALTQSGRGEPAGVRPHEGIPVWRIDASSSLPVQFLKVGQLMLRRGPRSFDLLHAKDGLYSVLSACLWARFLGIPVIREVTSVQVGQRTSRGGWKAYLHRSTYSSARMLHAVNGSVRAVYVSMGLPHERVWVSPYPVDTTAFRLPNPEERRSARERFGFHQSDIVHFALGRIHSHKNQALAVKALALLPDCHKLILAGPANEDYVRAIRETMVEYGLERRVILLAERQQDPIRLFHAADIYLVPSLTEGGPNVLFEALCCGLPVIVNESIGEESYVRDGDNGFNVPLEATEFAQAASKLSHLVHDSHWRQAIAEQSAGSFSAAALDPQYARRIAELLGLKM
jgi:glycosyltransferase involved in cell wall biosynthesis